MLTTEYLQESVLGGLGAALGGVIGGPAGAGVGAYQSASGVLNTKTIRGLDPTARINGMNHVVPYMVAGSVPVLGAMTNSVAYYKNHKLEDTLQSLVTKKINENPGVPLFNQQWFKDLPPDLQNQVMRLRY